MRKHKHPRSRPPFIIELVKALTECFRALAELISQVKLILVLCRCLAWWFFPNVAPPALHEPELVIAGLDLVKVLVA